MMTTGTARLDLPHHATSAGRARSFVRRVGAEAGLSAELCETAALLTSETVTNSFLHGRSDARLAVTADAVGLLVEVGDDEARRPVRRAAHGAALSGRGIALVAQLATEWGSFPTPEGKVVWFRLDRI
jgi:anti-sigma regulatory factor (Ser/Thr protein kinase)